MAVHPWVWGLTIAGIVALLLFDFVFHVRKAHVPSLREAAVWSALYVGIAVVFGLGVLAFGGTTPGSEYFAGYVTEKALSVDNLFVFLIIMGSFRVPREDQQKVLLFGIVFALVARTGLIFLGAALINSFAWIFYLFGLILLLTAGNMLKSEGEESRAGDNTIVRLARRLIHTTDYYDGDNLFTVHEGKRAMTPMLLVMAAIGGTDILFALDSIPAIFGLTQDTFLVFTATAFSLLGLRQLFFLLEGLLDRLIYLSYGLAAILAFIGVKLFLHALHENNLPFVNDGNPVPVVEISTTLSLGVIFGVLIVTVVASLLSRAGRAQTAINNARRHAMSYLDSEYTADPAERERIFRLLLAERDQIAALGLQSRQKARDEPALMALLEQARDSHDAAIRRGEATSVGGPRTSFPEDDGELTLDSVVSASGHGDPHEVQTPIGEGPVDRSASHQFP
jgi:tellurite resistance protein TerC